MKTDLLSEYLCNKLIRLENDYTQLLNNVTYSATTPRDLYARAEALDRVYLMREITKEIHVILSQSESY